VTGRQGSALHLRLEPGWRRNIVSQRAGGKEEDEGEGKKKFFDHEGVWRVMREM
jgi:hypothetical protein